MSEVININLQSTYPEPLVSLMKNYRALFFDYQEIEKKTLDMRLNDDSNYLMMRNSHAKPYYSFLEEVLLQFIQKFTIKGWHYTRLTENEVKRIKSSGLIPTTVETFKARVINVFEEGLISSSEKELIFENSPLKNVQQKTSRENQFWFTSSKIHPDNSGVRSLLSYWGGEVVYFGGQKQKLKKRLSNIGSGKIIEANVPISYIKKAYSVGEAILGNYFDPDRTFDIDRKLDFYIQQNLDPRNVKIIPLEKFAP